MDCSYRADDLFGPAVQACRRSFDFTLLFEESILSIAPAASFLLLASVRLKTLLGRGRRVRDGHLHIAKLIAAIIYGCLQLIFLVLWCTRSSFGTRTSIPAAAISLVAAFVVCWLSHLEHRRAIRPSPLLSVYLFLTLIFDAARARTLWLAGQESVVSALFTATVAVKLVLLGLESTSKRRYLTTKDVQGSPEETSGVFSQTFLLWLVGLLKNGYRKILLPEDLYPTDAAMSSDFLGNEFRKHWESQASTSPKQQKYALIQVVIKSLKWPLLAPVLPRLCLLGFTFAQPFLVNRVIEYLGESGHSDKAVGYSLMVAYGLVYTGIAAANTWYWHRVYRVITMIRGGLISVVYDKMLVLDPTAMQESVAVTLMSADIDRIVNGLKYIHELWGNILEVALATWLLERQIGLACLAMVLLSLVCTFGIGKVSAITHACQRVWIEAIQTRVDATATMLGSLKSVKMLSLERRLLDILQGLRVSEIESAKKFRRCIVYSVGLSYATLIFSPVLVFASFTAIAAQNGTTLDVPRMFTSLTLISLLASPLIHLFQALPAISSAVSCMTRIQEFLATAARHDYREQYSLQSHPRKDSSPDSSWVEQEGIPIEELQPQPVISDDVRSAIVVRDGNFGWSVDSNPILQDIDIRIGFAELVMVLGPVGSGKSTLLKGLLGEVLRLKGSVSVSSPQIAFCDQSPWLTNDTLRKNVIGPMDFDEKWYQTVIRACVLEQDIQQLPEGDRTMVGSKGTKLSGGQKQRLALARALYSRKDILLLDDIFSGLDRITEDLLFERLWGDDGILRRLKATVVFATHAIHYLRYANWIIALGSNGRIIEQGKPEAIMAVDGYVKSLCDTKKESEGVTGDEVGAPAEDRQPGSGATEPTKDESDGKHADIRDREVYMYYFRAIGKLHAAIFLFGGICFAFLLKFPDQWLTWWSISNTEHPNERNGYYLGVYAAFNVMAFISLCGWAWHLFQGVVATSGRNLHRKLLQTVMSAPFPFISRIDTGVTTNRFSQDMLLIDGTLPLSLLNTVSEGLTFIIQIGLIAAASAFILVAFPFIAIAVYVIQRFYLRTSKQLRLIDLEAKSPLYAHFLETSSGLALIRAFGWQSYFRDNNHQVLDASQKPFYLLYCVQVWLTLVLDLVVAGLAVVIIGIAVGRAGMLSTGAVGLALVNITTLGETLKNLVISWTGLETSMGAIARLETFTRETPDEATSDEVSESPNNWPSRGVVELKGISAAYRLEAAPVLKDVSLRIEAGQKVAICGRSGSGKTSLLTALCRMLDLTSGAIFIDDIDLSTIPRHHARSHLNVIPQDAYAFPGSVRANLDLKGGTPDEELAKTLMRVELWDKINELGGLDGEMNLEGLSAGQRQLFCLARAMVKRSEGRILLLDEATSNVDITTEKLMQRIVEEEFREHTVIAVLHRLGSALEYEKIAVLDKGALIDFDTPEKLVESNPLFKGFKR